MGKFQLGLIGMINAKPIQPQNVLIEGCCESVPIYLGSEWQIDNDIEFFPNPPMEDEQSICHIMGPGNIHIYFCLLTNNNVDVESPLEFIRGSYPNVIEAVDQTFKKIKVNNCLAITESNFIKRR